MNYKEQVENLRTSIAELKEDISTLNNNISEFEKILDSINSEEDIEKYMYFDIENGLKHIELY